MSTRFLLVTVRTSETGTPSEVFVEVGGKVADALRKAQVNSEKSDVTINGVEVPLDHELQGDEEIILKPRKYSSGFGF